MLLYIIILPIILITIIITRACIIHYIPKRTIIIDKKFPNMDCRILSRKNILGSEYYPFPNLKKCPKNDQKCNKKIWDKARKYYESCVNNKL